LRGREISGGGIAAFATRMRPGFGTGETLATRTRPGFGTGETRNLGG